MSKKQFLYLVLAALLFVGTGLIGVRAARGVVEEAGSLVGQAESLFVPGESLPPVSPYVALVRVEGTIAPAAAPSPLTASTWTAPSATLTASSTTGTMWVCSSTSTPPAGRWEPRTISTTP